METAELRKLVWLDSNTHGGWHIPSEQRYGALKCTTVGFLVHEGVDSVTLSGTIVFGDDHQVTDTMTIPKVCILSDKVLAKR